MKHLKGPTLLRFGRQPMLTVCLLLLFLGLYLGLMSHDYDGNGILEARALETGALVAQNHMLFRPIGWMMFEIARGYGVAKNSLGVLQNLSAVCGAICVALVFTGIFRFTKNAFAAVIGALWFGTTWAQWFFSTDVAYVPLAAVFAAAAICVFQPARRNLLTGFFVSLAILSWQASVFLIPVFLFLIWTSREHAAANYRRARACLALLVGAIGPLIFSYVAVAVTVYRLRSVGEIAKWFTTYQGSRLPIWGRFEFDRISVAAHSAAESLLPMWTRIAPWEHPALYYLSWLILIVTFGFALFAFLKRSPNRWLLLCYCAFLPFIVWWDPFEPKWFVVPNVFLGVFVGSALGSTKARRVRWAAMAIVLIMAVVNFKSTIWPRHRTFGRSVLIASCVAGHMTDRDLFVATDWQWNDHLRYFYNKEEVSVIGSRSLHPDAASMLRAVQQRINDVQSLGGVVYTVDFEQYDEYHRSWLKDQIGVTVADIQLLGNSSQAYQCEDVRIRRLPRTDNGATHFEAAQITIPSAGHPNMDVRLPGGTASPKTAFAELSSERSDSVPSFIVVETDDRNAGFSQMVVPAVHPITQGVIFIDGENGFSPAIAVLNPSPQSVQISFVQYDESGRIIDQSRMSVAPRTQISKFLHQEPYGLTNRRGTVRFQADAGVCLVALADSSAGKARGFEPIPIFSSGNVSGSSGMLLVPAVERDTEAPRLVLVNPAENPARGQVSVAMKKFSEVLTYDIPPHGTQTLTLQNFNEFGVDASPIAAVVTKREGAAPAMIATFRFNADAQARKSSISSVEAQVGYEFLIEVAGKTWMSAESISGVLALANVKDAPVRLSVDLTDVAGERVERTLVLEPSSQTAIRFDDLFDPPLSGKLFRGIARITATDVFFASAVRLHYTASGHAVFTAIPAAAKSLEASTLYFPNIVGGGGYATRFILFSAIDAASQQTLRFFDPQGKPATLSFILPTRF